ncbi:hypothetical protein N7492_007774 [Penicillium capsulatum]|uniref:Uncharacterized protein n=1 Tax=Penicillium capsulatum TaxID=69766 RepID=A0A9W9I0F6_9EURO|nr:hypothetical protein N7492_007774 [Penicillium capsulatum]KAJ6117606.1 hypothetical protein N7512_007331 [Penicillium capsulatum]
MQVYWTGFILEDQEMRGEVHIKQKGDKALFNINDVNNPVKHQFIPCKTLFTNQKPVPARVQNCRTSFLCSKDDEQRDEGRYSCVVSSSKGHEKDFSLSYCGASNIRDLRLCDRKFQPIPNTENTGIQDSDPPAGEDTQTLSTEYKTSAGDSNKEMILLKGKAGAITLSPSRSVGEQSEIPCNTLFKSERPYLDEPDKVCKVRLSCEGPPKNYYCLVLVNAKSKRLSYCGATNIQRDEKIPNCGPKVLGSKPGTDTDASDDTPVEFQTLVTGAKATDNLKLKITVKGQKKKMAFDRAQDEPPLPCSRLFTTDGAVRKDVSGCKTNLVCEGRPGAYKCLLTKNGLKEGRELSFCGSPDLEDDEKFPYCNIKGLRVKENEYQETHGSKLTIYKTKITGKSDETVVMVFTHGDKIGYRRFDPNPKIIGDEIIPCDHLSSRRKANSESKHDSCRVQLQCAGNPHALTCLVTLPGEFILHHCGTEPKEQYEICDFQSPEIGGGEDEDCDGDADMPDALATLSCDSYKAENYLVHLRSPATNSESKAALYLDPLISLTCV